MRRLSALLSLSMLFLAGCGLERVTLPGQGATINVVQAAGLRDTISLEIIETPLGGKPSDALQHVNITNPHLVADIIAALDTDLPLRPRTFCAERYKLRFILNDRTAQEFGYTCDGEESFLRGTQPFWQSMDVYPPDAFRQLIAEQIGHAMEAASNEWARIEDYDESSGV